jgi:hypothetical protein
MKQYGMRMCRIEPTVENKSYGITPEVSSFASARRESFLFNFNLQQPTMPQQQATRSERNQRMETTREFCQVLPRELSETRVSLMKRGESERCMWRGE